MKPAGPPGSLNSEHEKAGRRQNFVAWWCTLIGVTDPQAITIAAGIIAGGSLLLRAYVIVGVTIGMMTARQLPLVL